MKAAMYKASEGNPLDDSLTSSDGSWSLKRAAEYKARNDNHGNFIRICITYPIAEERIMVFFAARAPG
jgi:hypothetical protein